MHYFDTSRASPPVSAVRIRVALDVLEEAARTRVKTSPRLTLSELELVDGKAVVARVGTTGDISTLLWEVLAYRAADTDGMPWSDPAGDLPDAVLDAIASLTVRPAASLSELCARTKPALEAHASARLDLEDAFGGATVAPVHTPVVPADPGRITMRAPALTVDTLRTISKQDALVPRPARALPTRAVPAPRPSPAASSAPLGETPKAPPLGATKASPPRDAVIARQASRPLRPIRAADADTKETADPGIVTVAMAAVKLPAAARPSERPAAIEPTAPDCPTPPSGSRDLPLALARSDRAMLPSAPAAKEVEPSALPDLPLRSSETPPQASATEGVELGRGTLEPWGDSPSAAPTATSLPPKRRRLWPVVVLGVAASVALIGIAVQRSSATAVAPAAKTADAETTAAAATAGAKPTREATIGQPAATAIVDTHDAAPANDVATSPSTATAQAASAPHDGIVASTPLSPKPKPALATAPHRATPPKQDPAPAPTEEAAMGAASTPPATVGSSADASPTAVTPTPPAPTVATPSELPASGG